MSDRAANRLVKLLVPDEHLHNMRALREIVSDDAGVKAKAIPSDVLTGVLLFWVSGSLTAGSSIAQQWVMPTKARIRSVQVRLKTATGAAQQISVMDDGAAVSVIALAGGAITGGDSPSVTVDAGSLMEIKASASTGGNLSVTVIYESIAG